MNRFCEHILSSIQNITTLGLETISLSTSRYMTTEYCIEKELPLRKSTATEVISAIDSVPWKPCKRWKYSLFTEAACPAYYNNYIHADIFVIDGVGHILTTYGYRRVKRHVRKIWERELIKWL